MDYYEAVYQRRSIRDFTDEAIPEETLRRILEAAYQAPANDHFRDWSFIVVTDKSVMLALLEGVPKQYRMLIDAAAVVVPLMKKKVDILHPRDLSDLNCFASVWCSIENLWLAATAEGYGCNVRIPRGNEEAVAQKALGFPDGYLVPCLIGIGRPSETAVRTKQIPVDYAGQIHWQRF